MTLSACLIAHNEEHHLGEALESVRFANEIIVADCESTDETALIAKAFGARVFSRPNLINLNVNKNFTFDQATGDYIFCLDADEIVPKETVREIREILRQNPSHSGYSLPRRNFFLGRWLKHGGHYPDWQLRLFRRGQGRFPQRHVHERLHIDGSIGRLQNPLDHHPYESFEECQRKLDFYTSFEAQHLYQAGVRPSPVRAFLFLLWMPGQRFLRRYLLKGGFLDGKAGWQAIRMDMRNFRLRYRKLCELTRAARRTA
jgi:glycosyltransferase involved in cell wall biosynthesis